MKVGIVAALNPASGGMFQYGEMMLHALAGRQIEDLSVVVLARDPLDPRTLELRAKGWSITPLYPPSPHHSVRAFLRRNLPNAVIERIRHLVGKTAVRSRAAQPRLRDDLRRWLQGQGVDVVIFPAPDPLAFEAGLPSIMTIHDLQHRLQPEFPEVSADGEAQRREYLFRNAVARCLLILVDSEVGKEDVLRLYGDVVGDESKVKVLPFVPAPSLRVDVSQSDVDEARARLHLPGRFLFYPAQFWPHKNHVRIVDAIAQLHEKGISTPIVFTGSGGGAIKARTLAEVNDRAQERGVSHLVHHLGYVSDADMSVLYSATDALVMPTFFGPTNIPVIEAWNFGCPVITSDIRGIREQAGDAALLVDPRSETSIAGAIEAVWTDPATTDRLRSAGRRKLDGYTPDDYRRRLESILDEARDRLTHSA